MNDVLEANYHIWDEFEPFADHTVVHVLVEATASVDVLVAPLKTVARFGRGENFDVYRSSVETDEHDFDVVIPADEPWAIIIVNWGNEDVELSYDAYAD